MIILFWSSIALLITAFKHHLLCFRALRFTSKMHSMYFHTYRWCNQMFISIVDISISQQSSCLYSCRLLILNCPIQSSWLWLMQILDLKVTRLKVMSFAFSCNFQGPNIQCIRCKFQQIHGQWRQRDVCRQVHLLLFVRITLDKSKCTYKLGQRR